MRELLQIDKRRHRLQKSKDQPHNSADTPSIYFGVNRDFYERDLNESVLSRNVYLSSSNANDNDIQMKKTEIARQKSLYAMIALINVRTVCMLRKWYIMSQDRIKSRIKI